MLQNDQAFAAQCGRYSGSILPFVGTVDAARDLDRIRQAVGDTGLTYIGHSYGTLLGATYAELFPTHVRAMVLDGAIDPASTTTEYATEQAGSLETALQAFFAWCAADTGCPWRPSGDPTAALLDLIQQSRTRPLSRAGGGTAGPGEIYEALLAGLESPSSWPTLASALAAAQAGDGAPVVGMTDRYQSGGSPNAVSAEQAIDCLDHPVDRDPASYVAQAASAGLSAPVFGPLLAWVSSAAPSGRRSPPGPRRRPRIPARRLFWSSGRPATRSRPTHGLRRWPAN